MTVSETDDSPRQLKYYGEDLESSEKDFLLVVKEAELQYGKTILDLTSTRDLTVSKCKIDLVAKAAAARSGDSKLVQERYEALFQKLSDHSSVQVQDMKQKLSATGDSLFHNAVESLKEKVEAETTVCQEHLVSHIQSHPSCNVALELKKQQRRLQLAIEKEGQSLRDAIEAEMTTSLELLTKSLSSDLDSTRKVLLKNEETPPAKDPQHH